MKRFLRNIFIIISIAAIAFTLFGCNLPKAKDVVPEKLGTPEGLFIYKGNTRSLSDGSEEQLLIDEVELGGQTYSSEEYEIEDYTYLHDAHVIFFILQTDDSRYVYRYDYKEKSGAEIGTLSANGKLKVTCRDGYMYFKASDTYLLYDASGTLLCDTIDGWLMDDGLLYAVEESEDRIDGFSCSKFVWYYNGVCHSIAEKVYFFNRGFCRYGNYMYFLDGGDAIAINIITGEYSIPPALQMNDYDRGANEMSKCYINGALYFFKERYVLDDDGNLVRREPYLCKIVKDEASVIYEFDSSKIYWEMKAADDKNIYFKARNKTDYDFESDDEYEYYAYDVTSDTLKKIKSIPNTEKSPEKTPDNYIRVGDYEFYTTQISYTVSGGLLGYEVKYCYYFWRQNGNKKDVMQYQYGDDFFYDDICEF